jgi:tripartite-type tricarboxylate transporter receptor subunit TctC
MRARLVAAIALAVTALTSSPAAFGQADKTIKVIVPFAPGGGTDILARILAPRLAERLGQPVVVENRPGAGGAIGARHTAQAAPDGLTVMVGTISEIAINPHVNPKIGYDVWRDFALIGLLADTPTTVVVHPSVAPGSTKELIVLASPRPGQLNYGSAGTGSGAHMAAELFRYLTKVNLTHVLYKGVGAAVADLAGGQVQVVFTTVPSVVSFVKGGQVRALAVAARSAHHNCRMSPPSSKPGCRTI